MKAFGTGDVSFDGTGQDNSTERLIMQELEMKNGLETMLADQRLKAEQYKANFSLLETQHLQLQTEAQQLKDDLSRQRADRQSAERRLEGQVSVLQSERDRLLLDIEGLKGKLMTPAKLENLRQSLLQDVEMVYRQHIAQSDEEMEVYRKELNKLRYEHSFLRTEYENCQKECAQKIEDIHVKYKLEIDTLQRKIQGLKVSLNQKSAAADESMSLVKENTKLAVKIKSLATENENYRKQIADMAKKADERLSGLTTELSELSVKHEITSNENRNYVARVEKLQEKLEQTNSEITKHIAKAAKLEDQKIRFVAEIDDLKQKHKQNQSTIESNYKRQMAEISAENDVLSAQASDFTAKLSHQSKTIDQLKKSLLTKEKEFSDRIQGVKDDHCDTISKLQQEKHQLENKMKMTEKLQNDIRCQYNVDMEKLTNEIDGLQSMAEGLRKEKEQLSIALSKMKSNVSDKDPSHKLRLESEIQNLRSQFQDSSAALKEEMAEKERLRSKCKLANDEVLSLRSQLRDGREEFERIYRDNTDSWAREKTALKERCQVLKRRLGKGDKRRETILKLAKKQKINYQNQLLDLRKTVENLRRKQIDMEMDKDRIRKDFEAENYDLQRQIDKFRSKASEFHALLNNPLSTVSGSTETVGIGESPSVYSQLLAKEQEQKHELVEMMKNMNAFIEKQEELEKVF